MPDWKSLYLQAGRQVVGEMREQDRAKLVGVPFFDWPATVLADIDARCAALAAEALEPPPEVIEAWARDCRCCPFCRQVPCDGVMAGGMCDDFTCLHEERDRMDDDTEDDDDA